MLPIQNRLVFVSSMWAHIIRPYGRRVTMQGKTKGRNRGKAKSKEEQYWCWCSLCPTMPSIPTKRSPCRKRSPSTWQTLTKPPAKARRHRHRVLVRPMVIASPGGRVYRQITGKIICIDMRASSITSAINETMAGKLSLDVFALDEEQVQKELLLLPLNSSNICPCRSGICPCSVPSSTKSVLTSVLAQFLLRLSQLWHLSLLSSFFNSVSSDICPCSVPSSLIDWQIESYRMDKTDQLTKQVEFHMPISSRPLVHWLSVIIVTITSANQIKASKTLAIQKGPFP